MGLTLSNLSILKTGKAKAIRFSTLEAICEALGTSWNFGWRWTPYPEGTDEKSKRPL